jgi:hypothetical protein
MPGASPANKISIRTNQKGRAAANRPGAPPYHKHIRGQIMSKRIHGIGIGLALLLFVCLPALGQVIGLTPTPLANYYWNTTTASWTVCPNSSAVEASPNLPQAIALYGFNTSLGMWTPETSCPGASVAGVTRIIAGSGISISPSGGTGPVTISATGAGGSGTAMYPANANIMVYGTSELDVCSTCFYGTSGGSTITSGTVTGGVATFVAASNAFTGGVATLAGFTGADAFLNGQIINVITATGSQFTSNITGMTSGTIGAGSYYSTYEATNMLMASPMLPSSSTVYYDSAPGNCSLSCLISNYPSLVHPYSPVVTGKAGYLFLEGGLDDIAGSSSVADVESGLQSLWTLAHTDGWVVIALNLFDLRGSVGNLDPQPSIASVNDWMKGQGPQGVSQIVSVGSSPSPCTGCYWDRFIDIHADMPNVYDSTYYIPLQNHLNDNGNSDLYARMSQTLIVQNTLATGEFDCEANNGCPNTGVANTFSQTQSFSAQIGFQVGNGYSLGYGNPYGASVIAEDHIGSYSFSYYASPSGYTEKVLTGASMLGWSNDTSRGYYSETAPVVGFSVDQTNAHQLDLGDGSALQNKAGNLALNNLIVSGTCTGCGGGSSPLTTKGDLYGYSTTNARLPVGANTYVLTADSTQALGIKWSPAASGSASIPTCSDTSGSGTAQSCTTSPSFTPVAGSAIVYSTTTANTGTGLTLNVNSLGAKSVAKWQSTTTLAAGDIAANKQVLMTYDGTNWEMTTIGNAPSGGGGSSAVTNITGALTVSGCTVSSGACVVGTAGTTISLSAIPGTYNHLKIEFIGSTASNQNVQTTFNGDTASDYSWGLIQNENGGSVYSTVGNNVAYMRLFDLPSNSPAGTSASVVINVPFYAQTYFHKNVNATQTSSISGSYYSPTISSGSWFSTAAITSISLTAGANFTVGTSISIYGVE